MRVSLDDSEVLGVVWCSRCCRQFRDFEREGGGVINKLSQSAGTGTNWLQGQFGSGKHI